MRWSDYQSLVLRVCIAAAPLGLAACEGCDKTPFKSSDAGLQATLDASFNAHADSGKTPVIDGSASTFDGGKQPIPGVPIPSDAAPPDADAGSESNGRDAPPPGLCVPVPRAVSFSSVSILPEDLSDTGQIMTGSIRATQSASTLEVLVSEPLLHRITVLRGCDPDCAVSEIEQDLGAPVRAQYIDLDADGDRDLLVSDIGSIRAVPDLVGRVLLLDNAGGRFNTKILLEGVGRVACAEAADFDGDGDLDIVVCEFGSDDGSVLWLERDTGGGYVKHELRRDAGAIHAFPFDADGDGDLDIAVALSQTAQQVLLYRNDGSGGFLEEVMFEAKSEGFGLSGIELADLDGDQDLDVLVTGGDYFDNTFDFDEQALWWLENVHGNFRPRWVANAVGAYAVRAVDLDGDCDTDLVLACYRKYDVIPPAIMNESGLYWFENDGSQNYGIHELLGAVDSMVTLEIVHFGNSAGLMTGSFTPGLAQANDQRLVMLRQ